MQSPDWSHVANPSRCRFCRSENNLCSDEMYPEPASVQRHSEASSRPPRAAGLQNNVVVGSRTRNRTDSIRWWDVDEYPRWTDYAAETIGARRRTLTADSAVSDTVSELRFGTSASDSLELSDVDEVEAEIGESGTEKWSDGSTGGSEPDRDSCCARAREVNGQRRTSWSQTGRGWVVRRRGDGPRRRGDQAASSRPAETTYDRLRQNQRRLIYPHGTTENNVRRNTGQMIDTSMNSDWRIDTDDEDGGSVEWICNPRCIDSSYRIVAVI